MLPTDDLSLHWFTFSVLLCHYDEWYKLDLHNKDYFDKMSISRSSRVLVYPEELHPH